MERNEAPITRYILATPCFASNILQTNHLTLLLATYLAAKLTGVPPDPRPCEVTRPETQLGKTVRVECEPYLKS